MLGDFTFYNPTKLYFGREALSGLDEELPKYGEKVQFIYGGGSIKKNGVYDAVTAKLRENGKEIIDDGGVMPNPTIDRVRQGIELARERGTEFLLAVGGGSCFDYAKTLAASINCDKDPWEWYFEGDEEEECEVVPLACVLTMAGTGSEMNSGAVITNSEKKIKMDHEFGEEVFPRFALLNPEFTYSLPHRQMVAGIYDIFNHACEQYFSNEDDNTSDYLAEAIMRSVIHSSLIAIDDPEDYEARSNILWSATWALNGLIDRGKKTDWMVHMIGQAIGAHTNATHGMTLSAVSMPYYRYIMPHGLSKFRRFAENVWGVRPEGKTDGQIASEGLDAMEAWMNKLGVVMNISELGVTEDMFDDIIKSTIIYDEGYKVFGDEDIRTVLKQSL